VPGIVRDGGGPIWLVGRVTPGRTAARDLSLLPGYISKSRAAGFRMFVCLEDFWGLYVRGVEFVMAVEDGFLRS
jgi:hypothetical protein